MKKIKTPISPKILICEDNFETIDILKKKLIDKGFEVTLATNGQEAIEAAKIVQPDLFILDIMLSGDYTGIDVLKFVKSEPALKNKPVVILTNLDSERDEALKYKASEYLVKSNVTLRDIVNVAEKYLHS